MNKRWTIEEETRLILSFQEHKDSPDMGKAIFDSGQFPGRTLDAINSKRHKLEALKYRHSRIEKGETVRHANEMDPMRVLDENTVKGLPVFFRDDLPNNSDIGGSLVVFVFPNHIQLQSRNMVPREAVKILAKIIEHLV